MKKIAFILSSLIFLATGFEASATPLLLTISETENQESSAWWPSQFGSDKNWVDAFSAQGLEIVETTAISSKPKLSPVVYGSKNLSNKNAKTLGSLFGTTDVLNGNVTWTCAPDSNGKMLCDAQTNLTLLYDKNREFPLSLRIKATGPDKNSAKNFAIAQIVSQVSLAILAQTRTSNEIPTITDKPMLILSSLPNADTLVTLRKRLKRIPGVNDVAERWIANGALALDINPDQTQLSQADFSSIIQRFITETDEGISVRETGRSDRGVVFEVVTY